MSETHKFQHLEDYSLCKNNNSSESSIAIVIVELSHLISQKKVMVNI